MPEAGAISSAPEARYVGGGLVRGRGELLACRSSALEFVAEVLKVFLADLQLEHFFDHGHEVCQRADRSQRRGAGGPDHAPRRSQNECVLHRFEGHAALVKLGREHSIRPTHGAARARSRTVSFEEPPDILVSLHGSALRIAQRRTLDGHGVAVMPHAAEQRVHHRFVAEKVVPLVID